MEEKLSWLNLHDKFLSEMEKLISNLIEKLDKGTSELKNIVLLPTEAESNKLKLDVKIYIIFFFFKLTYAVVILLYLLQTLDEERENIQSSVRLLWKKLEDKGHSGIPPSISKGLSSLEIQLEKFEVDIERLRRDIESGKDLNFKYDETLRFLSNWIKDTDKVLETESEDPELAKNIIQVNT